MKFRETTQEDLDFAAEHSISRGVSAKRLEYIDYCYTLEHEGNVLCVGGIRLINLTTAWCWVKITDCAEGHIVVVYRVIKEWIDSLVEEKELRRLQCYVEVDFPAAIRMVEHLGFHREFDKPMKNFVGDKDAFLYVRII